MVYPPLCVILLLSLQQFSDSVLIMSRSLKWYTQAQSPMETLKWSAKQQIRTGESFHVHAVAVGSIPCADPYRNTKTFSSSLLGQCITSRYLYEEWVSSQKSSFKHWTKQCHRKRQCYISAPTFLYEIVLFRSIPPAVTFFTYSSELPCIHTKDTGYFRF